MNTQLEELLERSKSLSDLSRYIFGKENYTNREKCKKILAENGINWETWLAEKKVKPKRYCLYCGKEITDGDYRKKFCNSSCSASYNNIGISRNKKNKQNSVCLNCGKEIPKNHKYCNNSCKSEYEYKQYIERWKNGFENGIKGVDDTSNYVVKYLRLKHHNKCELCGWNKEHPYTHKVPLQVHHIDGNCMNNKEENLQLLCPNCHSLTETFGALNKGRSKRKDKRLR